MIESFFYARFWREIAYRLYTLNLIPGLLLALDYFLPPPLLTTHIHTKSLYISHAGMGGVDFSKGLARTPKFSIPQLNSYPRPIFFQSINVYIV